MKRIFLAIFITIVSTASFANVDNTINDNITKHWIETMVEVGAMGFNPDAMTGSAFDAPDYVQPYASVGVRACTGSFCPELVLQNSTSVYGSVEPVDIGEKSNSYSNYYLKIPTMIPLNFLAYPSIILLDFEYDSLTTGVSLAQDALVDGTVLLKGAELTANYTTFTVRMYLDTPVVINPSLYEHSYFGVYYSYISRLSDVGSGVAPYLAKLAVKTNIHAGGIFYDVKKNMIFDGFNFGINVHLGYGDLNVVDDITEIPAEFGNLYGLVSYKVVAEASYRHEFDNGIGLGIKAGVNYNGSTSLLGVGDETLYEVDTAGYLKYYATLSVSFDN